MKNLCQAFGVSGYEDEIRDCISRQVVEHVDDMYVDNMGNLICYVIGDSRESIMFTAHMDEIGVMVSGVDEECLGRVSVIGGVYSKYSLCNRVRFESGHVGIVFADEKGDLKVDGCGKKLKVGDVACFEGDTIIKNDTIISKALDNRLGCHVLIETIKRMGFARKDTYFVFTAQEETGLKGSGVVAHRLKPDMAINVDITSASKDVKLKEGVAIKVKDRSVICHPKVNRLLQDYCNGHEIKYQLDVSDTGGTDTGAIQLSGDGIVVGAISIPIKYTHSISEMASLTDVERAIKLLIKVAEG